MFRALRSNRLLAGFCVNYSFFTAKCSLLYSQRNGTTLTDQ
jgi:hypothetical protein